MIATTAVLHFTHAIKDSDSLMALGLTPLTVEYDAVLAICRTWHETGLCGLAPHRILRD
ncbi:hypothetical protein [Streptomyces sp. NPDC001642]|uniref:hypothetical protein n=1 Tax=Streptomyces sp. NPDC001642 TaxID=3154392 RepID=UPI00332FD239